MSATDYMRSRRRYFATRLVLDDAAVDYSLATNASMFKSDNRGSTNYDATRGYDDGTRYNIRIAPETNPIFVRFNSSDNDPIYVAGDTIYEEFNIPATDILLTSADAATTSQIDRIVYTAELGTKAVSTITPADFAGSASGDYVVFYDAAGQSWALSLDKTGAAAEPTGAIWVAVAAARKDHVDISTATTAEDICNLLRTALTGLTGFATAFTHSGSTTLIITRDFMGPVTASDVSNTGDTGNGSIAVVDGTAGVASNHNSTYVKLYARDATSLAETVYGLWYNVNSEGTEPTDTEVDNWLPTAFAAGATAGTIGAAAELVIDAVTGIFTSEDSTPGTLNITHSAKGPRTNAVDASSPDTITTPTEGAGLDTTVSILVR